MPAAIRPIVATSMSGSMRSMRPLDSRKSLTAVVVGACISGRPPSVRRPSALHEPRLLHVEQLGQDAARHRSRGVGAEAARLIGDRDHILGVRIGGERHVPGLVRLTYMLGGPGLAGDRD